MELHGTLDSFHQIASAGELAPLACAEAAPPASISVISLERLNAVARQTSHALKMRLKSRTLPTKLIMVSL